MCVIKEACSACSVIVACSGTDPETQKICNHGFLPPDGVRLCSLKPAECAVSAEQTIFVPPEQYQHNCVFFAQEGVNDEGLEKISF